MFRRVIQRSLVPAALPRGAPDHEEAAMPDHTPVTTDDVTFGIRDRLLLAFAELEMYGIDAPAAVEVAPARARAAITARLRARAPHGLGSYVFWTRTGEPAHLAAAGAGE